MRPIIVSGALAVICSLSFATASLAQYKMQTATGQQTVAPSSMPQQPMVEQQQTEGLTFKLGNLQRPIGIPSSIAQGPQTITLMERVWLGLWIVFQTAILLICAVALYRDHRRVEEEFQGGHMIKQDFREPLVHGH